MLSDFFLWCAGASKELLKQCKESDRKHQEQLGAHVFFTALLGCFSSIFALSYAFDTQWGFVALFACLWGVAVFLFDRTLIISPILTPKIPVFDSKNRKYSEWGIAWAMLVIRVIMAILLALFISTPLELKIFQPEIDAAIVNRFEAAATNSSDIAQAISDLDKQLLAEMANQEKSLEPLEKDTPEEIALKAQLAELSEKYKAKTREREGEFGGASSGIKGYGSHALQISRELEVLDKETKEVSEKLRSVTERHGKDIEAKRADQQRVQDKLKHRMGVLRERQGYLESIASEDAKKEELARLSREQANSAANGASGTAGEETAVKIEALAGIKLKDVKKASLLERLKELDMLRTNNNDVYLVCLMIWCLFIFLETMPIMEKLLFRHSAYDLLLLLEKETSASRHIIYNTYSEKIIRAQKIKLSSDDINNTRAAVDEFLEKNRRELSSVKAFEWFFEKYLMVINKIKRRMPYDGSRYGHQAQAQYELQNKQLNAKTYLIVFIVILLGALSIAIFFLYYMANTTLITIFIIVVGLIAVIVGFGTLYISARKLQFDSKNKDK